MIFCECKGIMNKKGEQYLNFGKLKKFKIPTYSDCLFRRFFVILHLLYNK